VPAPYRPAPDDVAKMQAIRERCREDLKQSCHGLCIVQQASLWVLEQEGRSNGTPSCGL